MPKTITIEGFKLTYVFKGHLKHLFPRTSNYLNFILPLRHPSKINSYSFKLKDIPVYFTYGGLEEKDENGKLVASFGGYASGIIVLDLKYISSYLRDVIVPSRKREFTPEFCKRFASRFDSITKYRSILIHEYEHFIQDEFHLDLDSEDYKVARSVTNFTSFDCDSLSKKLVSELSQKEKVLKILNEYIMTPKEIEARLSQWIFLLIKGHSVESIKSFEKDLFKEKSHNKDPADAFLNCHSKLVKSKTRLKELDRLILHQKKLVDYYHSHNNVNKSIIEDKKREDLEAERIKLEKSLPGLEFNSARLHVATVYFDHMMREAERVASLFKKRYNHLVDVI